MLRDLSPVIRWTLALALGVAVAWLAYGRAGASQRVLALVLAALRAAAVTLIAAMVFGASSAPATPLPPLVAIDVSASWLRAAGDDSAAVRTLRTLASDAASLSEHVVFVGDSLREVTAREIATVTPSDGASHVRVAIDRAAALGRALVLLTDGELDDADALADAPQGSRVRVPARAAKRDAAVGELALPTSATAGDTLHVSTLVVAGGAGSSDGQLQLLLDGARVGAGAVAALAPYASTRVNIAFTVPRGARIALVQAVLRVAGDVESRNDTLSASLEIGDKPPAVFISTAPDLDVREALTVLRGALQLPTRAYLRLAPGVWREEGSLAPIREEDVRTRAAVAGMLILHGDTNWVPRTIARGARALWTPAPPTALARAGEVARTPEWYASSAPASPLVGALGGLPFDSLPPLTIAGPARGDFTVLAAKLGKMGDAVPAISGREAAGARTLIISGSGYAGWALRGGRSGEAFTALWGAIFDWLSAGRGDLRAARPVSSSVRAGEAIRWRRGGADSLVTVLLTRRRSGSTTTGTNVDTIRLHFASTAFETSAAPMAAGVYDVRTNGGPSVLVVNPSREWVPRAPMVRDGPLSRGAFSSDAPRLSDTWWPFVLALLLLCAEWIGRRFAGLR